MLTTKDVKIKDTAPGRVKIITSNEAQAKPSKFKVKGKAAHFDPTFITTSNLEKYQKKREKEMVIENAHAKERQKKLDEAIRMQEEKTQLEKAKKAKTTGETIAALEQEIKELRAGAKL